MTSFLNKKELDAVGFKSIGDNVKISRYARFYGVDKIIIVIIRVLMIFVYYLQPAMA